MFFSRDAISFNVSSSYCKSLSLSTSIYWISSFIGWTLFRISAKWIWELTHLAKGPAALEAWLILSISHSLDSVIWRTLFLMDCGSSFVSNWMTEFIKFFFLITALTFDHEGGFFFFISIMHTVPKVILIYFGGWARLLIQFKSSFLIEETEFWASSKAGIA